MSSTLLIEQILKGLGIKEQKATSAVVSNILHQDRG